METFGTAEFPQSMEINILQHEEYFVLEIKTKHPNLTRTFCCEDVKLNITPEIINKFKLCELHD